MLIPFDGFAKMKWKTKRSWFDLLFPLKIWRFHIAFWDFGYLIFDQDLMILKSRYVNCVTFIRVKQFERNFANLIFVKRLKVFDNWLSCNKSNWLILRDFRFNKFVFLLISVDDTTWNIHFNTVLKIDATWDVNGLSY